MDLNQKIIAGLLLAFFLITLLRIFRTPLRLALKLLMNTALGFLALWAVNATAAVTGVALGLNLLNALTVGGFGAAGFCAAVVGAVGAVRVHSLSCRRGCHAPAVFSKIQF